VTLWGQKHFSAGELVRKDGSIIQYKMLEPRRIKASKKYPLVIFLHGAGEGEWITKNSWYMVLSCLRKEEIGVNSLPT
jgi:predicted peptidase